MARTQRDTVQYFPHDTHASEGDTLTIVESNFGNDGYAFWFKLLERLGSTDGHFIDCNNPIKKDLLFARAHITTEKGITIVEMLAELGAIDKQLWQHRIIWSQHFVDNVADVYENRRRVIPSKPIITSNNPISTESNPITTISNPQSRVNDIKLDETEGNKRGKTLIKKPYGQFNNVLLTDNEVTKLKEKLNGHFEEKIEYFSEKKSAKGYTYKSDYAAILTWERYDEKKNGKIGHKPTHTAQTGGDPDKFTRGKWGAIVAQRTADVMAARNDAPVERVIDER